LAFDPNDLRNLEFVEIGATPYLKSVFPDQTSFFSTYINSNEQDPDRRSYTITRRTLSALWQAIHRPDVALIVCQPTFFSPWHWRWIGRMLFHRRVFAGHISAVRTLGPQFLRMSTGARVAIFDQEDIPFINRNNFFLLERCHAYFKRELPADRWRLFNKTAHSNLPSARFRGKPRYLKWIEKIHPISLGLPLGRVAMLPGEPVEKTTDVFFAGKVERSSSIRPRGLAELLALRDRGLMVDISEHPLPPEEFYRRCASARIVWSPEGYGWDCFRHYEAAACRAVPMINCPTIERYEPLTAGVHALFYDVEPGGLTKAVLAALSDKPLLSRLAEAARRHVLAHHTPSAIAHHVVQTALADQGDSGGRDGARVSSEG
jgi:hypothetical protein